MSMMFKVFFFFFFFVSSMMWNQVLQMIKLKSMRGGV